MSNSPKFGEKTKVVIYAVNRGCLLVLREPQFPELGLQPPSGTVESGEDFACAAARELAQQSGLLAPVAAFEFLGRQRVEKVHDTIREGEGFMTTVLAATAVTSLPLSLRLLLPSPSRPARIRTTSGGVRGGGNPGRIDLVETLRTRRKTSGSTACSPQPPTSSRRRPGATTDVCGLFFAIATQSMQKDHGLQAIACFKTAPVMTVPWVPAFAGMTGGWACAQTPNAEFASVIRREVLTAHWHGAPPSPSLPHKGVGSRTAARRASANRWDGWS